MKLIILILLFIGVSPWSLLTSIVAFIKIQINKLKDNFFNLNLHNLSGGKILSKLYSHKYVCKRTYSTRKTNDKNSGFYEDHTYHWTETVIYKDKYKGYFYIAGNFTTNSSYVKVAGNGILHDDSSVYLYDKYVVKKLDSALDVEKLIEYLKNVNINPIYSKKVIDNSSVNMILNNNFESTLENNYGCKDLINLTANIIDDINFNKILFIIEKDLGNKKID